MSQPSKLLAKAFYTTYGAGENVLDGWSATPAGDPGIYRVIRADGTSREVALGSNVPGAGPVMLNEHGNLQVGNHTVIVGENLISGWTARKNKGTDAYLLMSPDGEGIPVTLGGHVNQGPLSGFASLDTYGNLQVGEKAIVMLRKEAEVRLVVLTEQDRSGYLAYINTVLPGQDKLANNGVRGVFYPASGKKPAAFCEAPDGSDVLYRTAVFHAARNGRRYVVGKLRPLSVAIQERTAYDQVRAMEEVARSEGYSAESVFGADYQSVKQSLDNLNESSWKTQVFTVEKGLERFQKPAVTYDETPAP